MAEELEIIEQVESRVPATLFNTDDPAEVIERATRTANALADVVKGQKLSTTIQGREHVRVEGWTLLGSMLGVFPITVWTRPVTDETGKNVGWEARVEARTRDGAIVGAAEAECLRSEKTWANRDSYALRSMAQTRGTSKALRHPLGFVMTIAGFEATPEEEMPPDPEPEAASKEAVDALVRSLLEEGYSTDVIEERFAKARTLNRGELSPGYVAEQTEKSAQRLAAKTGAVA